MTGLALIPLLWTLAPAQAPPKAPGQSWIADVRANRATLVGKDVWVTGTVVDIRSNSAEARRGLYRMIDESDREGVLIRTTRLPRQGGTFKVRTIMAKEQPEGALLLEEVARTQLDAPPLIPRILTYASAGFALLLGIFLARAVRQERQYLVSPPLWLLPDSGPYGKNAPAGGGPAPALKYDPDLEEVDRQRKEHLRKRRQRLGRMLLASLAGLVLGAGWLTATRPARSVVPAFLLLNANEVLIPGGTVAALPDSALTDRAVETPIVPPAPATRDTARSGAAPKPAPAPPPGTRRDTVQTSPAVVLPPAPAPSPAPAPAPPPPAPLPPPPEVKRRSAEELRVIATEALAGGVNRIVAAANAKRTTELLVLLPDDMAGDQGRLERFVSFVKGFAPRATLGAVEPLSLEEEQGQARFTVSFVWRGDFGVERRKAARFLGVVRRQGDDWRFEGAKLLDAVP